MIMILREFLEDCWPLLLLIAFVFFCAFVAIYAKQNYRSGVYDVYVYGEKRHDDAKVNTNYGNGRLVVQTADGRVHEYYGSWEIVSQ